MVSRSFEEQAQLRSQCQALSAGLQELADEALQVGNDRSVPGAIDVFQQASCALDRLCILTQRLPPITLQTPLVVLPEARSEARVAGTTAAKLPVAAPAPQARFGQVTGLCCLAGVRAWAIRR